MNERDDLTTAELAKRWKCSAKTVCRIIDARLLDNVLVISRSHRLIPRESVEAYEARVTLRANSRRAAA